MAIGNCDGSYHLTAHRCSNHGDWNEILGDRLPQSIDGRSIRHYVGGDFYIHLAPGFEYCLDAPTYIPAGGHCSCPMVYDF